MNLKPNLELVLEQQRNDLKMMIFEKILDATDKQKIVKKIIPIIRDKKLYRQVLEIFITIAHQYPELKTEMSECFNQLSKPMGSVILNKRVKNLVGDNGSVKKLERIADEIRWEFLRDFENLEELDFSSSDDEN